MQMVTKRGWWWWWRGAIHISEKIDFKSTVTRDKGHYIMIKGSIHQEDITIINIYASNIRAPYYIKKTLAEMKGEINSNTVITGDFNIPFSIMDRTSRQKISKETEELNNTMTNETNRHIQNIRPKAAEYTFLSAQRSFSRIDHMLGHKTSLSKFKKIEIVSSFLSDHNRMKPAINSGRKTGKFTNTSFPPYLTLQCSYETFCKPKWCKVKKQLPQDRSC